MIKLTYDNQDRDIVCSMCGSTQIDLDLEMSEVYPGESAYHKLHLSMYCRECYNQEYIITNGRLTA